MYLSVDQISIKTPKPQCRLFLKIDHKTYLAAAGRCLSVFEAPDPPPPPPVTHCMNSYLFTQGSEGGGDVVGEPVRRLEGRYSSPEGSKIPT
jgi:hypothetical protein